MMREIIDGLKDFHSCKKFFRDYSLKTLTDEELDYLFAKMAKLSVHYQFDGYIKLLYVEKHRRASKWTTFLAWAALAVSLVSAFYAACAYHYPKS